uniref:Uncharacterized protein n=1 Tax=Romanomermis culicivorax TaxID=13658 RepID=A0A915IZZ7_ROMCU
MPGNPSRRVPTFVNPVATLAAVGGFRKSAIPEGKRKEKRKKNVKTSPSLCAGKIHWLGPPHRINRPCALERELCRRVTKRFFGAKPRRVFAVWPILAPKKSFPTKKFVLFDYFRPNLRE